MKLTLSFRQGQIRQGLTGIIFFGLVSCVILNPAIACGQDTIIKGGWLFDGVGDDVVKNSGIVIVNGTFLEVGANLAGRDLSKMKVIELTDNDYILPGIFDLHAHHNIQVLGVGRADETEVNPVIFLANGVTSVNPCGEYNPEEMMELKRAIARGEKIGPRMFNTGPYFGTARRGWNREATREDIYRDVDYWAEQGVGNLKAKGIQADHLRWLIERGHQQGLTVSAHLDSGRGTSVNPKDAILMGLDRVEHFLGGDSLPPTRSAYQSLAELDPNDPRVDEVIELYLKHQVIFDATMTAYGYFGKRSEGYDYWVDERKFFTPEVQAWQKEQNRGVNEQFEKIYWVKRKMLKKFYDAGGTITLGTDHPSWGQFLSGFGAHRELDAFVLSGIPPAAALKIATINGARALNVSDKLGSIEPGKFADLFVIKGNPLEDIRRTRTVHTVMKAGQVYQTRQLLDSVIGKMGPKK